MYRTLSPRSLVLVRFQRFHFLLEVLVGRNQITAAWRILYDALVYRLSSCLLELLLVRPLNIAGSVFGDFVATIVAHCLFWDTELRWGDSDMLVCWATRRAGWPKRVFMVLVDAISNREHSPDNARQRSHIHGSVLCLVHMMKSPLLTFSTHGGTNRGNGYNGYLPPQNSCTSILDIYRAH